MPLVRLSFLTGKSAAWRRAVSDAVQQAMVETIDVPPADRFHVMSEHAPGFLVIDPTYPAVARSDDPLVLQITLRSGRSDDKKRALYRRITGLLAENPGVRRADVMIVLSENAPSTGRSATAWRRMHRPDPTGRTPASPV